MKNILLIFIYLLIKQVGIAQSDVSGEIKDLLSNSYPIDKPGSAIIVVKGKKELVKGCYGLADIENNTPISTSTMFRIGSMTKQFTAIAILMMVEEGKLDLETSLTKFYPDLFNHHPNITIRHLLTHTSGIIDLSKIQAVRPLLTVSTKPDSLVQIISKEQLLFIPGSQYEYSNSGYVILGAILEKVSGIEYEDFLKLRIFEPLEMTNTRYANSDEITKAKAKGYFARPEGMFASAPDVNSSLLFSAGGLWSSVDDMAKWDKALYTESLLSRKYIEQAFAPAKLNSGKETDYGFAFRSCMVNGKPSIEHGGGVFGFSSYGIRIEKEGIYVLILSNYERNNPYDDLAAKIAAIAMAKPYAHRKVEISKSRLDKLSGVYIKEEGDTLVIDQHVGNLLIKQKGKEDITLIPLAKNQFLIHDTLDDIITFEKNGLIWKPRRAMARYASKID